MSQVRMTLLTSSQVKISQSVNGMLVNLRLLDDNKRLLAGLAENAVLGQELVVVTIRVEFLEPLIVGKRSHFERFKVNNKECLKGLTECINSVIPFGVECK